MIKHESGKKSRHIAMRSLLKRAGKTIQTLKPCFMMSPMSVAQYLEPGKFSFDIVVMDEASQILPEDALGAIARGASVVVVGDPKQLPPTAFFQNIVNNDNDDDAVAVESSNSILEAVLPMFKTRCLRWHYRSKHESLVEFSNHHFYGSNLILFPSPWKESDEFGIRFHYVTKGCFVDGRNKEEAKEVINTVMQLLQQGKESLGIVAMNLKQREEIENELERRIKNDALLEELFKNNQEKVEPVFIKNLENVQGDERDDIIISMTYGPERIAGKTMQRFGPINSDTGWRRLNVLFTRSKKRMHIFSSMKSEDVVLSAHKGVRSLKAFLEYCDKRHLDVPRHTGKPSDSDFEISVINALKEHGYDCEPQLGVSGYFLDIAVIDPGRPGRFLMGIECDGATYHSAKSTRDRDRLRQDILEELGWEIRRIWSSDWFNNPAAHLEPILRELEKIKTPVISKAEVSDIIHAQSISID
ncbi:MAG: DUF559 domain-containing protein [Gammaproteobacteria bacterium]|nr:DUF559 domain-containing protein [Gammaproteobacteria bacterium]